MTWNPFKKKSTEEEPAQIAPTQSSGSGKGRPTPKRKKAEEQNLRPIVPADRKAANKAARAKARAKQDAEYEAMQKGDIKNMPKAEQLPWRIYIRDYVDARWNVAEWFIPSAIVLMVLSLVITSVFQNSPNATFISMAMFIVMYGYIAIACVDLWLMWRKLKAKLVDKYGERAVAKGMRSCSYACSRAMQVRRWRMPKPRTDKRGQYPR